MKRIIALLTILFTLNPGFALSSGDTTEKVNNLTNKYNNIVANYNVPALYLVKEFREEFGEAYYIKIYEDRGFFGRLFGKREKANFYRVVINPDDSVKVDEVQNMGLPSASISTEEFNKLYSTYIDMDPFSIGKKELIDMGKRETIRLAFKVNVEPDILKFRVIRWVFSILI